jgi:hypothetical protein
MVETENHHRLSKRDLIDNRSPLHNSGVKPQLLGKAAALKQRSLQNASSDATRV